MKEEEKKKLLQAWGTLSSKELSKRLIRYWNLEKKRPIKQTSMFKNI